VSTRKRSSAAVLGVAVGSLVSGGLVFAPAASATPTDARITEIHYDNSGTDTGEAIEVTAPSSVDLKGLTLVLYNGNGGGVYDTRPVSRPATGQNAATTPYPSNGIQNGDPDGVALIAPSGAVIEFLSYEGTFTAVGGPADGMRSVSIGVREAGTEPAGQSLQRDLATGVWSGPKASTFAPDAEPLCAGARTVPIGEVQGDGAASPCQGATVTIAGTVVGDTQQGLSGFFVQDAGDGDPSTSDGIFVFGSRAPQVALGDQVTVIGKVSEFNNLTEISQDSVQITGSGMLPAPTDLPLPSSDAQREALEGMFVAPTADLTVTEVFSLDTFGEIQLAQGGRLVTATEAAEPGPAAAAVAAENARRSIVLDDGVSAQLNTQAPPAAPPYLTVDDPVRVGDTAVLESVVLSQRLASYRFEPADGTSEGTTFAATNPRPVAPDAVGGDLRIADFNVLNYFVDFPSEFGDKARGATDADELAEQQAKIVTAITALDADVITLHEIENSAILTPETPYRALETLVDALNQAQGPDTWRYVRAHEASDVITNAIIYRVSAASPVGEPMKPVEGVVWDNAREPIAQTFRSRGEVFSVIANHLKSKGSGCGAGSDDPQQGNCNGDRVAQATALAAFAVEVAATAGDPDVLLTGDFNSYRNEDPLDVLRSAGFTEVFTPGEYSYVFQGGSGSLDHVFATATMLPKVTGHTIWDINATESFAYEYDAAYEGLYAPYAFRASDHNPTLVGVDTKSGTPVEGKGRR
jgi:predicted extracellular nuclease